MATETLRPDATGAECSIASEAGCSACPNHYDCIYEVTADGASTEVYTNVTSYQRDLYDLPASSGSGIINKITVYFRCLFEHLSCHAKASIKSNSTVTDGAEKTAAGIDTWETFTQEWAVNPADSGAWEWADIDALQIGVSLLGYFSDPFAKIAACTQVYVEVDYTPLTVTTQAVSSIEEITATGNGNITATGGENADKRGVCWSTSSGPDVNDDTAEETDSFGTGAFTASMTGLSPGTKYYVKAYAHNSAGYAYGSEVNFVTKPDPPTILAGTPINYSQIDVLWAAGSGAEKTMVRRKVDSYPTSVSDGTQAYFDTSNSFSDTGLDIGANYYYRAWSYTTDAPSSGYSDEYSSTSISTAAFIAGAILRAIPRVMNLMPKRKLIEGLPPVIQQITGLHR